MKSFVPQNICRQLESENGFVFRRSLLQMLLGCSWCCCCRCCWLSHGCCQRQHNHRRVLLTLLADNWQTKNTAYRTHNNPGAQFAPCHVNETVETNATDPQPKRPPFSQPYKRPTHCQLSCGLNFPLFLCFLFFFTRCLLNFFYQQAAVPSPSGYPFNCHLLVASPTLDWLSYFPESVYIGWLRVESPL